MIDTLSRLFVRELQALSREVGSYPDDASVWATPAGVSNSAGTLALHAAGNLQHYLGAVLGGDGYVRDREGEFGRRGLTRSALQEELERAVAATTMALSGLTAVRLEEPYPDPVAGRNVRIRDFLLHLLVHLGYHLGQVDYHRRLVTGEPGAVGAVAVTDLPDFP